MAEAGRFNHISIRLFSDFLHSVFFQISLVLYNLTKYIQVTGDIHSGVSRLLLIPEVMSLKYGVKCLSVHTSTVLRYFISYYLVFLHHYISGGKK